MSSGGKKRSSPPFLRRRVQRSTPLDRVWRILGISAACLGLYALALGDSGWLSLSVQKSEVESLQEQIDELRAAQASVRADLDELEKPASFELERVARDEYGLVREGERVLHVVEPSQAP